jgi:predicted dehydrogenase
MANVRKLRLGVIGAGVWAVTSHLPTLANRRDEVEFVSVCRKGEREARSVAERFGFQTSSEDYRDVLGSNIDICIVSSPAALHYEHAKAALESGAHVLVEKPFTLRAAEAWDLVYIARRLQRHLLVSFGWNYLPTFLKASALMARLGIGKIEYLSLHMGSGARELLLGTSLSSTGDPADRADTATWTDPKISGGGYAQAQLPHALGFALGLTQLRAQSVYALAGGPSAQVELHAALTIRFREGAIGSVSGMSFHSGAEANRHHLDIRLGGSEGQLHVDLGRDRLWMHRPDVGEIGVELPKGAGRYDCEGPPIALLELAQGKPIINRSPGELGAATVEILEAAYKSMETGQPEPIEGAGSGRVPAEVQE